MTAVSGMTACTAPAGGPTGRVQMTQWSGAAADGVDDTVHDPGVVDVDGTYYLFSTGHLDPADPGGISVRRSKGSLGGPWEPVGALPLPKWTRAYQINHLWAPHVTRRGGTYYLYYAASSFGTNHLQSESHRPRRPVTRPAGWTTVP